MLRRALATALPAALALSGSAGAGPCLTCSGIQGPVRTGWWNDRPVSSIGRVARHPRIDAGSRFGEGVLAVVWEDETLADGDIWIATGGDGGCGLVPRALFVGPQDDRSPDVAIFPTLDLVAVAFVRDATPVLSVSRDGGASFDPPVPVDAAATVSPAGPPRLGLMWVNGAFHLHVVWVEGTALRHARSLAGGQAGTWESGSLPALGVGAVSAPDLAVGSRSIDSALHSSLTLVFSAGQSVFTLRSNDSGASFFGDPVVPSSRDLPRSIGDAPGASRTQLDGSDDGSGVLTEWSVAGWSAGASVPAACLLDAREEEGATPSVLSDWNDPGDVRVLPDQGGLAALALVPNPLDRPPAPDLHVFGWREAASGPRELRASRGILDASTRPNLRLYCGPYDLTGQDPPRAAGEVEGAGAAADEDHSDAYLVWTDTRDGAPRVYLKRSDTLTGPPLAVAAQPAACALGGGVEVAWNPPPDPPHCDVARYRIEYGTSPGVYPDSIDSPASPARLTGLVAGSTVHLRVVTIDEACNEAPSSEVSAQVPVCGSPLCPNGVGGSLRAVRSGTIDVRLSWQPGPVDAGHHPAESYEVWRSVSRGQDGYLPLAGVVSPTFTDPAAATPRHFYQVVARNACGTSGDEPPR